MPLDLLPCGSFRHGYWHCCRQLPITYGRFFPRLFHQECTRLYAARLCPPILTVGCTRLGGRAAARERGRHAFPRFTSTATSVVSSTFCWCCCWCCCRRVHTATPRELQYPLPLHAPRAPAFVLPPQGFSCWCSFLHNGRVPTMEAQHISLLRQGRVALAFHQTPPTIILRSPDFSCCCTSQVRRQHHRTFVQPRLRHRRVPTMVWHSTLPC